MKTVVIAPVGLYAWRVLRGIKKFRPDRIFFLLAKEEEERPEWHDVTLKNLEFLEGKLGYTYEGLIETVHLDFNNFNDVFVKIHNLVEDRTGLGDVEFFIDITSTPLLPRMALVNIAAIHRNVEIYYTPPENKQPKHYDLDLVKNDKGKDPIVIPTVRSKTYDELKKEKRQLYREILIALGSSPSSSVESHARLMNIVGLDKGKRSDYMYLGRVLSDLQDMGLVVAVRSEGREKGVSLTLVGRALAETFSREESFSR